MSAGIRSPLALSLIAVFGAACGGGKTGGPAPGVRAADHKALAPSPQASAPATRTVDVATLEVSPSPDDRVQAVALREKACTSGDTESCVVFAQALMTGAFVDRDPWRAAELFTAACQQNNGAACESLAEQYDQGLAVDQDHAKATELWTRACELEQVWACDKVSESQRAFDIELARCERGDASACSDADLFRTRGGVSGDIPQAAWRRVNKALDAECSKGIATSCRNLAYVPAVSADRRRALLTKACELGDPGACNGRMYGETDAPTIEKFAKRGCELGDADACRRFGEVTTDPVQALEPFRRACSLGHPGSCEAVATASKKAGDSKGERNALSRQCALSASKTCLELARADEASGDRNGAILHFGRACALGKLGEGCAGELRVLHAACATGDQAACDRKAKRLTRIQASKRDLVAWICCHAPEAAPDTPAAAVIALATVVLAKDAPRLRALVHPTLGLTLSSEDSFDGRTRSSKHKLRSATITPEQLTTAMYEDLEALRCREIDNARAACRISDPMGFDATYSISIQDGRAYVIGIDVVTWGHS